MLQSETSYTPNETELKIITLTAKQADLTAKNNPVSTAYANVINSRIARDTKLYCTDTGLFDIASEIKKYVKSVFGTSSPQFAQVKGIQFKKVNKYPDQNIKLQTTFVKLLTALINRLTADIKLITAFINALTADVKLLTAFINNLTANIKLLTAFINRLTADIKLLTAFVIIASAETRKTSGINKVEMLKRKDPSLLTGPPTGARLHRVPT